MSRHQNPAMPSAGFGLLLVEGGDELAVCKILAGAAWSQLCCWKANGRDLPNLARLARNDPNFHQAFEHPQGIDATHTAFAPLRAFIQSL
jgi:hypothetical protein